MDNISLDVFLSLIRESDLAFEQLLDYFSKQEEKVLVCMFGDHQPALEESVYTAIFEQTDGQTEEEKNLYKTPFVIWANYDIEEEDELDISMNYLGEMLLEVGGIPKSKYFAYLHQLKEEYPIITLNGFVDKNGTHHSWSGDNNEFSDYRILQYYYLFDCR